MKYVLSIFFIIFGLAAIYLAIDTAFYFLLPVGVIVIIVAIFAFRWKSKECNRIEAFKNNPNTKMVKARLVDIYNATFESGNQWFLICAWNNPQNGKKYVFSRPLLYPKHNNFINIIEEKGINEFEVYFDSNNISKYYIEIDCFLGEKEGVINEG